VDNLDRTQLRAIADTLRNKLQSGVVVLGTAEDGRVSLISAVTKDLAGSRIHAGKLVGAVAEAVGGKGGGRPDLAEAGGKDSNALSGALDSVYELIERMA
jgi:alanyl-tRNA synthetase